MRTSLLSTDLGLTLARSKGVPGSITVDGVTYGRLRFGGQFLDVLISSQPLYGRV